MKSILAIAICISCSTNITAQKKIINYYDYLWQPCESKYARFVAIINETDSGWVRKDYFTATNQVQMVGKFRDSACKIADGYFYFFYPDGKLLSFGKNVGNKKEGTWLSYHYNGMMSDSSTYSNHNLTGTSLRWYADGSIADSIEIKSDGTMISVGWFANGNLSYAGMSNAKGKQGKWKYYHDTGFLSAEERYENDLLADKKYYDEDGVLQTDITNRDRNAQFKAGINDWLSYVARKAQFPSQYNLANTDKVTVMADYIVDETGNLTDIYLSVPVHPAFDREILNAIKRSPKWEPAVRHNRRVRQSFRQPLTFEQPE
jgi:hypothetical protein